MTFFESQNYFVVFPVLAIVITGVIALLFIRQRMQGRVRDPEQSGIVFLAERGQIIDETPLARMTIGEHDTQNWHWTRFHDAYAFRFPRLPDDFEECLKFAPVELQSAFADDNARLSLQPYGSRLKITLSQRACPRSTMRQHVSLQKQTTLRTIAKAAGDSPFPAWIQDKSGHEIWRNEQYKALRNDYLDPSDKSPLFELEIGRLRDEGPLRYCLPDQSELGERWYEVSMTEANEHFNFHAANITALVRAERAQRGFVQTLTKTFAQLGTGLAIFDRDQQLVLFNPALVELTKISAEFLTAKPSLTSFFDWLRESRMMPEPRNYAEWRDKLNALSSAAAEGTFSELWSLPNGLSYRVLGRPHPDGAVAFLFEDVTAQLSLTRNFVTELEINHEFLDHLPQALAIFSPNGDILSVNQTYRDLWNEDPDTQVQPISVSQAVKSWSQRCYASEEWGRIEAALLNPTKSAQLSGQISMLDNQKLAFRVVSLNKGATSIQFDQCGTSKKPKDSRAHNALTACPTTLDA